MIVVRHTQDAALPAPALKYEPVENNFIERKGSAEAASQTPHGQVAVATQRRLNKRKVKL